jgi:uroporphyrinogen decarboxylase
MTATATESDFRSLPLAEMEAIIDRFEERVNAAQRSNPATKSWVKEAIRRRGPGRSPVRLKRLSFDIILRYGGALAELFSAFPDDVVAVIPYDITVGYQPPGREPRINPVEVLMRDAQWTDEWGTRWGHAFGGVGATPIDHPLKDWSQLDDYLADRVPDPRAPGRMDAARSVLDAHGAAKYCYGVVHLALFERLHALRGMQNIFTDFCTNETETRRLMDALQAYLLQIVRRWAEIGADGVFMTDDWGSQSGLMISPELWRRLFKPYYAVVFDEVHRLGMDVLFHSCGNVADIVGDLIEIGLDVLDPVQPGAMDIETLARKFGGCVAFSGAVDVQELLARGAAHRVKDEVRRVIDTLGRPFGGSLLLGPANVMTPDIPFENLVALFEAAHGQS